MILAVSRFQIQEYPSYLHKVCLRQNSLLYVCESLTNEIDSGWERDGHELCATKHRHLQR